MLYFCYGNNGHVGSETISTDIFKLKCTAHVPVYLFADAKDDVFLTCHYYVSTNFNKEKNLFCIKWRVCFFPLRMFICFFPPRPFQDMDENHPGFSVFQCTRCEEKFDRASKLDDIRDHLFKCSIRVPKFVRTCRFCGLVRGLFFFPPKKFLSSKKKQRLDCSSLNTSQIFHHKT